MLKIWNVSLVLATGMLAILGTFLVRSGILDSIHAFGASTLGVPFLVADRRADRRLGRARRLAARRAALRAPARLAALARGGLPAQQPRARRALLRDLLGDVLPADLRGADGQRGVGRPAVVRPLHRPAGARARAAVGHRAGDRLAARDGGEPAPQPRCGRRPSAVLARSSCCCSARRDRLGRRAADVRPRGVRGRRASGRSCGAACARGGRCRATRCRGAVVSLVAAQPPPLRRLPRARRGRRAVRRAWRRPRPSRTRATSSCGRPDRARRRLRHHLREADGRPARRRATGGWRRSTSARCCASRAAASTSATLRTERSFFPSRDPSLGPVVALLRGRGDERGRPARRPAPRRLERDLARTCATCASRSRRATSVVRPAPRRCRREQREVGARRRRSTGSTRSYAADPPPATFRLIVSPLVSWIWIGALIVFARRADRALAAAAPRAAAGRGPLRRARGARARPRVSRLEWTCCWSSSCSARRRARRVGAAAARARGGGRGVGVARSATALEAAKEAKYARSATPSSTTAPASSPRRTGARRTARCAPRRSSILRRLDDSLTTGYPADADVHHALRRSRSSSPSA